MTISDANTNTTKRLARSVQRRCENERFPAMDDVGMVVQGHMRCIPIIVMHHLRETSFFNELTPPCPWDCPLCVDAAPKDAYMLCMSRGDWWNAANAFGDV